MEITDLLTLVPHFGASDLHLHADGAPTFRLHGQIVPVPDAPPLTRDDARRLIYDVLTEDQRKRFETNLNLDLAVSLQGVGRFRLNVFVDRNGPAAAFRWIPETIRSLAELGMPDVLRTFARFEDGLVLITGPTGSGKSTTMAAMVDLINTEFQKRILTIEDPVEFVHRRRSSTVSQREIGAHARSFADALRAALREDPDVIMVGELRDLESISLAVTAAETGHLVLGTLHTPGAPQAVDRMVDVFPRSQQAQIRAELADSLRGVAWQILLPQVLGGGRIPAVEVLVGTPSVSNLIRENKTFQMHSVMETGSQYGMRTMDQVLTDLVTKGWISSEVALRYMRNPELRPEAGAAFATRPAPQMQRPDGVGGG
ncbi:MAG TPA: type IV pilus twitching motility protein PilT [Armatimonadota bacterium]|jgi:twitching motility protein PilT